MSPHNNLSPAVKIHRYVGSGSASHEDYWPVIVLLLEHFRMDRLIISAANCQYICVELLLLSRTNVDGNAFDCVCLSVVVELY